MADPFDFSGRSALVTGAASGIGAALARWLAQHAIGTLHLVDVDGEALDALELDCEVIRYQADVADPEFWAGFEREVGRLNHAAINAGVASGAPIAECRFDEWRRVMSVNLDGAFLSLRAAMRAMTGPGSIVLSASISGVKAEPGTAVYGASKAALIQLAKVAAKEGAGRGLRVNAIAPGGVDTPIWDQTPFFRDLVAEHGGDRTAAMRAMAAMATPLGRYASSAEIAEQIGFLLSDAAATITGAVLVSDGGYSL